MAEEIKVWGEGTKGLWSPGKSIDVPDGYIEIPTGDPFITRKIKQLAEVVYIRMERRKRLGLSVVVGLLAPEAVVREAISEADRTRDERERKKARSQIHRKRQEEKKQVGMIERINVMFPRLPEGEAEGIVSHAFEVGSGRVGRTSKVADDRKIDLAVRAHIRHAHTNYDSLLAAGWDRELARDRVCGEVERIYNEWRSRKSSQGEDR